MTNWTASKLIEVLLSTKPMQDGCVDCPVLQACNAATEIMMMRGEGEPAICLYMQDMAKYLKIEV